MQTTSLQRLDRTFADHSLQNARAVRTPNAVFATAQRTGVPRGETDFYLQESYRIVDLLRRAVADRDLADTIL